MKPVRDQIEIINHKVMAGLKDFQNATVNRIDELYRSKQMRVMVSDEVGLGKTLIARGTVAKVAKMLKKKDMVKVVYICSNAAIADQNLNKLKISRGVYKENVGYSRLSMQHLNLTRQEYDHDIKNSFIQLIPLTPDTSFRIANDTGTKAERALMYGLLCRVPSFKRHLEALEVIMMDYATTGWSATRDEYQTIILKTDELSGGRYTSDMLKRLDSELDVCLEDGSTPRELLIDLCRKIEANGMKLISSGKVVGAARMVFAGISLKMLKPDLVIMDEFQRFKELLNVSKESDMGMLAGKFFQDKSVRMLLLSATPYKLYSTMEEIDETDTDEHFVEFFKVMEFLNKPGGAYEEFKDIWQNYSIQLKEYSTGDITVIAAKSKAEDAMYKTVCRTERIAAGEIADLIDDSSVKEPLKVTVQDVRSYIQVARLIDQTDLGYNVPVDYVKSSPYLMSFMRDYKLRNDVERYFKCYPDELSQIKDRDTLWLHRGIIRNYKKIQNNNARLDLLMEKVLNAREHAELLLWVPPSIPYYKPEGVFSEADCFSKTLVFSSWEMVPRMIASLMSYEVERRTVGKLAKNAGAKYFGEKRFPPARLKLMAKEGLSAAFCLLYPSVFLSDSYHPLECLNEDKSLKTISNEISKAIRNEVREKHLCDRAKQVGAVDKRWYYMAPLLMDDEGYVREWLQYEDKLINSDEESKKDKTNFKKHIRGLKQLYEEIVEEKTLLGKMPDDLVDVLTNLAIASPAVCIKRAYSQYVGKNVALDSSYPSQMAYCFLNRMDKPESVAVIQLLICNDLLSSTFFRKSPHLI